MQEPRNGCTLLELATATASEANNGITQCGGSAPITSQQKLSPPTRDPVPVGLYDDAMSVGDRLLHSTRRHRAGANANANADANANSNANTNATTATTTAVTPTPTPTTTASGTAMPTTDTHEQMPPVAKRQVRTSRINCRWLYNQTQASRGLILIDTRSRAAFEEDSLPSALSMPPMPACQSLQQVLDAMLDEQRYLFSDKKRKLREVVLFGDAVKQASTSPRRQQELLPQHQQYGRRGDYAQQQQQQHLVAEHDASSAWLQQLERLLVEDGLVASVKVLSDGFLTFKYRYPFFTTAAILNDMATGLTRTQSGTHNVNYPNEILDGFLFLGNMWHAQSRKVMAHLGITHIVNASLDTENVFESAGVVYHEVKLKDRVEADIAAHFNSTHAFIESAKRTQHARVLVHCTQGISRSATLVIMYLMRAHQWSLVTAVNYAVACRGVVYPNQGFLLALMQEEYRLYRGNSLTEDEADLLMQHQIPDRPVPLQMRTHKSENCPNCRKVFRLLEWKHRCSYCRKEFCSKCTSTRLALSEREKSAVPHDEARRAGRVCDCCMSRLWKINLPRPRKTLQPRSPRCKHLYVSSLSTFGKPVCISYFEGTESHFILDAIKARFGVQRNQIIDLSMDSGEEMEISCGLAALPDEATVLVSVGNAGVQDEPVPRVAAAAGRGNNNNPNGYGHRYHAMRNQALVSSAASSTSTSADEMEDPRQEKLDRLQRIRFSSAGNVDTLLEPRGPHTEMRRSNSFVVDKVSELLPLPAVTAIEDKFRELWSLSFPAMHVIDRSDLLRIQNPLLLTDVMLGLSSLSCGALTLDDFNARLMELGYAETDREFVINMLARAQQC